MNRQPRNKVMESARSSVVARFFCGSHKITQKNFYEIFISVLFF